MKLFKFAKNDELEIITETSMTFYRFVQGQIPESEKAKGSCVIDKN